MFARITRFIKKPASKDIAVNTTGNYLNVLFVSIFALVLVRNLSISEYGILSVLLGIAYVLANILDLGTTATIYSSLPPLIEKKSYRIYHFLKSIFIYQTFFSLLIIGLLIILFPFLDKVFFKTGAPRWQLTLTSISVLFFIWQNFVSNSLLAAKKFVEANILINLSNLVKTIVLGLLLITHNINTGSVIAAFGIVGPVVFFAILLVRKRFVVNHVYKADIDRREIRFRYTLTYFIASQFFNLGTRMDLFLVSFFLSNAQVGYYGLSQKIILMIMATVVSVTQVLSPMFSKIRKKREILRQIKASVLYLTIPTFLYLILAFFPKNLFILIFTAKFSKTVKIIHMLAWGYVIYPITNLPLLFILYTIKKPFYILIANISLFIIITVGCYWFIPFLGVFAPAYVLPIAFLISGLILAMASVYEYRKLPATID